MQASPSPFEWAEIGSRYLSRLPSASLVVSPHDKFEETPPNSPLLPEGREILYSWVGPVLKSTSITASPLPLRTLRQTNNPPRDPPASAYGHSVPPRQSESTLDSSSPNFSHQGGVRASTLNPPSQPRPQSQTDHFDWLTAPVAASSNSRSNKSRARPHPFLSCNDACALDWMARSQSPEPRPRQQRLPSLTSVSATTASQERND